MDPLGKPPLVPKNVGKAEDLKAEEPQVHKSDLHVLPENWVRGTEPDDGTVEQCTLKLFNIVCKQNPEILKEPKLHKDLRKELEAQFKCKLKPKKHLIKAVVELCVEDFERKRKKSKKKKKKKRKRDQEDEAAAVEKPARKSKRRRSGGKDKKEPGEQEPAPEAAATAAAGDEELAGEEEGEPEAENEGGSSEEEEEDGSSEEEEEGGSSEEEESEIDPANDSDLDSDLFSDSDNPPEKEAMEVDGKEEGDQPDSGAKPEGRNANNLSHLDSETFSQTVKPPDLNAALPPGAIVWNPEAEDGDGPNFDFGDDEEDMENVEEVPEGVADFWQKVADRDKPLHLRSTYTKKSRAPKLLGAPRARKKKDDYDLGFVVDDESDGGEFLEGEEGEERPRRLRRKKGPRKPRKPREPKPRKPRMPSKKDIFQAESVVQRTRRNFSKLRRLDQSEDEDESPDEDYIPNFKEEERDDEEEPDLEDEKAPLPTDKAPENTDAPPPEMPPSPERDGLQFDHEAAMQEEIEAQRVEREEEDRMRRLNRKRQIKLTKEQEMKNVLERLKAGRQQRKRKKLPFMAKPKKKTPTVPKPTLQLKSFDHHIVFDPKTLKESSKKRVLPGGSHALASVLLNRPGSRQGKAPVTKGNSTMAERERLKNNLMDRQARLRRRQIRKIERRYGKEDEFYEPLHTAGPVVEESRPKAAEPSGDEPQESGPGMNQMTWAEIHALEEGIDLSELSLQPTTEKLPDSSGGEEELDLDEIDTGPVAKKPPPAEEGNPAPTEPAPPAKEGNPAPTEPAPPAKEADPAPTEPAPPAKEGEPAPTEPAPPAKAIMTVPEDPKPAKAPVRLMVDLAARSKGMQFPTPPATPVVDLSKPREPTRFPAPPPEAVIDLTDGPTQPPPSDTAVPMDSTESPPTDAEIRPPADAVIRPPAAPAGAMDIDDSAPGSPVAPVDGPVGMDADIESGDEIGAERPHPPKKKSGLDIAQFVQREAALSGDERDHEGDEDEEEGILEDLLAEKHEDDDGHQTRALLRQQEEEKDRKEQERLTRILIEGDHSELRGASRLGPDGSAPVLIEARGALLGTVERPEDFVFSDPEDERNEDCYDSQGNLLPVWKIKINRHNRRKGEARMNDDPDDVIVPTGRIPTALAKKRAAKSALGADNDQSALLAKIVGTNAGAGLKSLRKPSFARRKMFGGFKKKKRPGGSVAMAGAGSQSTAFSRLAQEESARQQELEAIKKRSKKARFVFGQGASRGKEDTVANEPTPSNQQPKPKPKKRLKTSGSLLSLLS